MPLIVLGLFFYWNHYQAVYYYAEEDINMQLNDLVILMTRVEKSPHGKDFVLEYIQTLNKKDMFVIEKDNFLYNNLYDEDLNEKVILEKVFSQKNEDSNLLYYRVFDPWQWKVGFIMHKNEIVSEISLVKGYIFVLIPLFILFSLVAVIFIANNIAKPINILLEGYNDIISGNFRKEILIERKDELGLLGDAFNDMKNKIAYRTNKLIQMKNFNEDILRNISTGIITTNSHGKIVKYNQAALNIIEEISYLHEKDTQIIRVLFQQIMETLKTLKVTNRIGVFQNYQEGSKIYLDISTSLMKNENNENIGVICSFNDITNRKKVEEKIEGINRLTSLGELAAGLAHEIRNPLSGMKMSCQVLKKRLNPYLKEGEEKLFHAIIHEIDRINGLVTNLLDFSKPNLPRPQKVEINEILENAFHFSRKIILEKNITIEKYYPEDLYYAYFDRDQLAQIFLNIIANAVQSMEPEGVLKVTVKKSLEKKCFFLISFKDNGCGISAKDLDKIFDPFYTTYDTGTGLGLSVVYQLIHSNKGEIEVQSQVHMGTKFKLYIPMYTGRDENDKKSINY